MVPSGSGPAPECDLRHSGWTGRRRNRSGPETVTSHVAGRQIRRGDRQRLRAFVTHSQAPAIAEHRYRNQRRWPPPDRPTRTSGGDRGADMCSARVRVVVGVLVTGGFLGSGLSASMQDSALANVVTPAARSATPAPTPSATATSTPASPAPTPSATAHRRPARRRPRAPPPPARRPARRRPRAPPPPRTPASPAPTPSATATSTPASPAPTPSATATSTPASPAPTPSATATRTPASPAPTPSATATSTPASPAPTPSATATSTPASPAPTPSATATSTPASPAPTSPPGLSSAPAVSPGAASSALVPIPPAVAFGYALPVPAGVVAADPGLIGEGSPGPRRAGPAGPVTLPVAPGTAVERGHGGNAHGHPGGRRNIDDCPVRHGRRRLHLPQRDRQRGAARDGDRRHADRRQRPRRSYVLDLGA